MKPFARILAGRNSLCFLFSMGRLRVSTRIESMPSTICKIRAKGSRFLL